MNGAAATSFATAVTVLVNELAAASDEVTLVLDDYHLIDAAEVHRSLEFLLDHLPAALHLVLASRSDPPLPLARLRARGQLTELRADELRFTPDETADLLRVTIGHDLPAAVVAALGERTEGWAAGLQLAALSLQGRADVTSFVEEFSGSHRFVLDYLTEEVLERQPEDVRTFLLETSILERLSGSLCDAVVGGANSQQTLESMERASLFLIPLDAERRWWRYHHLFADLLRANLLRLHPEAGARAAPRRGELVRAARAAGRRHPTRTGSRRGRLGGATGREAPRGTDPAARRGRNRGLLARCAPVRDDPAPAGAGPRAGQGHGDGRPAGRGRTAADDGGAGVRPGARRALPGLDRPQPQPLGQRAGRHRHRPRRPGSPARRRRPGAHVRRGRPHAADRARRSARRGRPLPRGVRGLDRRAAGPRGTRAGRPLRRAGRIPTARPGTPRGVRPRRGPAGPGQAGCGAAHLPARAGGGQEHGVTTDHRHGVRRAGRGGLRAGRAVNGRSARDTCHRAVPPARLRAGSGGGPGHAGPDPAGRRRPGRRTGRRRRGRGRDAPGVGRPALSRLSPAGPADAGRGEHRRGRSLAPGPRPDRAGRAVPSPRARVRGARAAADGRAQARCRPRAAGAVAGTGDSPGSGGERAEVSGAGRRWPTTWPETSPPRWPR